MESLIQNLNLLPSGVILFDTTWKLLSINLFLREELELINKDLTEYKWFDLLKFQDVLNFNNKILRFLQRYWSYPKKNELVRCYINKNIYKDFLVSSKYITHHDKNYILCSILPIDKIKSLNCNALSFKKSLYKDVMLTKEIQRYLNNSMIKSLVTEEFNYSFYTKFIPCNYLTGDIINITPIQNFLFIFIGDVKGHGLPAAFYSSLVYSYINILVNDVILGEHNLSTLVSKINKLAYKDFIKGKDYFFFSGIFILVDMNNRKLSIVNAAHTTLYYIESGDVYSVKSNGTLVGIFDNVEYDSIDISLKDNQTFLLYTDGVIDSLNKENELLGEIGVYNYLTSYCEMKSDLSCLHDNLFKYLVERSKGLDLQDDISILVMNIEKKYEWKN